MPQGRRDPNNITMYNVSKKLVSDKDGTRQVRFKYSEAFDGYAGVTVPRSAFTESANSNFWHIRMPKTLSLDLTYKTGIRKDDVVTRQVTPREFKDLFEKTRLPKQKKPKEQVRVEEANEELDGIAAEMDAQSAVHDMDEDFMFPFE